MYELEEEELRGSLAVGWQLIFNRLDCFPSRIRAGPDRGTPEKKFIYKKKKGEIDITHRKTKNKMGTSSNQPKFLFFGWEINRHPRKEYLSPH
jgi:hypothetical protein